MLGKADWLVRRPRPKAARQLGNSEAERTALPEHLLARQIRARVNTPGFRANEFYLIPTLTDAESFPAETLADLYRQRWDVELFLRDLETTMGVDILRCKIPAMVEREILMHLLVYDCMGLSVNEAAQHIRVTPDQMSLKAAQQALRHWQPMPEKAVFRDCS